LRALVRGERLDREMDEEMRFHLEMLAREKLEEGMSAEDARSNAFRQFGGVDQIKETCRERRGTAWIEHLIQDAGYGLRMLRKSPAFTAVAVLSLALGIGANTTIFSLLDAVLWRALPVRDPRELRAIYWVGHHVEVSNISVSGGRIEPGGGKVSASFPYPTYLDFRDRGAGFSDVFAFVRLYGGSTVLTPAGAATAEGLMVSGNFFRGYGAQAMLGRTLSDTDDRPEAAPAAVITCRWWERQFGSDPNALGRSILVNRSSFTVVGILPREFVGPIMGDPTDFYIPMSAQPQLLPSNPLGSYHHWWVEIMARMSPGADERQSAAALEVLFKRTLDAPGGKTKMDQPRILLQDGSRGPMMMRERFAHPLYVLWAAVGMVLLIACANIAGLMLARGAARRHEYAVRATVGAGPWRLVRQSLTESLTLSLAGAGLGLAIAGWGTTALLRLGSSQLFNIHLDARIDARVFAFTSGMSLMTVLLFGLLPALRAAGIDPLSGLKQSAAFGTPRLRIGKALVVAQVALSLVLVIGAGLFVRTFVNLARVDPGFETDNLLLFRIDAGQAGYKGQQLAVFYENLRESVAAIPGTRSVAFSSLALLSGSYTSSGIKIPGRPAQSRPVGQLIVSDSFLATMDIPLLRGRELNSSDNARGLPVAVVNESFARTFFAGEDILGKTVMLGSKEYRIVGVCRDSRYNNLRSEPRPMMLRSFRQADTGSVYFEVRSVLPPMSLVPAVRKALSTLDGTIPLTDISSQTELIDRQLTLDRIFASLCSFTALLALLLSSIGLYGLLAYTVSRRTNEIGVRMALGARTRDVAFSIMRGAFLMAVAGSALGIAVACAMVKIVESQLYGVAPSDPVTIAGSTLLLLGVSAIAAWIPAVRAARIDPLKALRTE